MKKDKYKERKEVLTSFFSNEEYESNLSIKQIAALFGVKKAELEEFKSIVNELELEGIIIVSDDKICMKPSDSKKYFKGIFTSKNSKYGFVKVDGGKEEYHISESNLGGAIDEDIVIIRVVDDNYSALDKLKEAKIVKILKRSKSSVVGVYSKNNNFGFVKVLDGKMSDIFIPKRFGHGYKDGDVVETQIIKNATITSKAEGKIISLVGKNTDDYICIKALYKSYGLDSLEKFDENVEKELKNIPEVVSKEDEIGREDKTDLKVVTIDSEDAKDLDDACYVEKIADNKYLLSVFIADVSHYVKPGSFLDKEAIARGTSIYIPSKVLPMLPKKLSNGICSLNEGVKRLALAVDMIIDDKGNVLDSKVYKAVIKVAKKMTYEKVFKVLENKDKKVLDEYKEFRPMLKDMNELSDILHKKRKENGSIDFDIPEVKVYLDEEGKVKKIEPYKITKANNIIEEFMLITNMVIAERFFFLELPFIYRVHEKPDEEKLRELTKILSSYSIKIKAAKNVHPKSLANVIDSIQGLKEKEMISYVMLKALKLARYSNECLGHFGLAAKYYTHFTSPIRRYPDLFIHRVISDYIKTSGNMDQSLLSKYEKQAYKYSFSSSECEKNATKVERDFISMYEAIYMKDFIGEKFEASVCSVTSFGMFVRLDNLIEGFVPFENMPGNDYYIYDEKKNMLIGERTSKSFKYGDNVTVILEKVNCSLKQIDFKVL